jgi:hypothetical protein
MELAFAHLLAPPAIPEKSANFRRLEQPEEPPCIAAQQPSNLSHSTCLASLVSVKPELF